MKPIQTIDLGNKQKLGDAYIQLTAKVYYDEYFNLDKDLEFEDDKQAVRDGKFEPVVIVVQATLPGTGTHLIGRDDLSGVLVANSDDLINIIKDQGMIDAAIFDLKEQIKTTLKGIETFKLSGDN